VRIAPLDPDAPGLTEAYAAAFPPGHPDWAYTERPDDFAAELRAMLAGEVAGPVLPCSRLAVTADGEAVGALIVTDAGGHAVLSPWNGTYESHVVARSDTGRTAWATEA
jgi:hypothetical protein